MTAQPQPEQALVRALDAGEERAFNELVGRYHRSLIRLARNFVHSDVLAEEVAQDTWCAVMTGIERFQGRSSLKTWIFSICVNKARTRAERERRTVPFSTFAAESGDGQGPAVEDRFPGGGSWTAPPRAWEDPQRRAISLELREDLRDALEELPERQRLVVTLRDVEGVGFEEIGRLLELSPGNTRVLLHRGRTRLRTILADALAAVPAAL
jgi:RNA polymerase sigma-70 factor, ECF subfamily